MDNIGSTSADVEAWTLVNYLEEGGFPALLWGRPEGLWVCHLPRVLDT
jgi:hypothetical protein